MQEIEVTSRLYIENGARYMTATLMCQSDTESPKTTAVTFILAGHRLITVRYDEPRPFTIVSNKLSRICPPSPTGETVMMDLLDAVIDRAADILERIGADVDQVSHDIFEQANTGIMQARPYNTIFVSIGRKGEPHLEGAREPGLGRTACALRRQRSRRHEMAEGAARDAQGHAARRRLRCRTTRPICRTRFTFLLDAMLGVVSLQQNNIIKIFSVAAVVFMPPTLVASIYGMNFHHNMPELEWEFGYPFALALMVLAAVVPYLFFKWRKWL